MHKQKRQNSRIANGAENPYYSDVLHPTWRTRLKKNIKRNFWLYMFILPTLVWYLIFCYGPMGGVIIAFKRYTGIKSIAESQWVGLKWFKSFFGSHYFKMTMKNTLVLSLYTLLTFPLPILLALMLNEVRNKKVKTAIQTVLYAPHFISTVVLVSMLTLFFAPNGFMNVIIKACGGNAYQFMSEPKAFPHLYVWSGVWQTLGWNCIIYVAALANVDPTLHEAAIVDGATRFQRIMHIDIPTIMPTIMITLILQVGQIMSVSTDKVLLMRNDLNMSSAETIGTFVYQRGLLGGDYSYAAAVGLFLNIINLILLLSVNLASRKMTDSSLF